MTTRGGELGHPGDVSCEKAADFAIGGRSEKSLNGALWETCSAFWDEPWTGGQQ